SISSRQPRKSPQKRLEIRPRDQRSGEINHANSTTASFCVGVLDSGLRCAAEGGDYERDTWRFPGDNDALHGRAGSERTRPAGRVFPARARELNSAPGSEVEHHLLLHAVRARRKVAQRHEEVWILAAAAQRVLNKEETLERHAPRNAVLEAEVIRANV